MKYKQFKSTENIDRYLLLALGALKSTNLIVNIDLNPDYDYDYDYDLTNYDKGSLNTYFVKNKIDFSSEYTTLLRANLGVSAVFHWNDIDCISKSLKLPVKNNEEISVFLQRASEIEPEIIEQGMETSFDDFELNSLKIDVIDNINKEIVLSGAFVGNSYTIDPLDWRLVVEIHLSGIPEDLNGDLYLELLAESYSLSKAGSYKLAFFLSYTALECYLNSQVNPDNKNSRLKDSFSNLFKRNFTGENLNQHEIYSSISGDFDSYTTVRNEIAHGRKKVEIPKEYAIDFLTFVLVTVVSDNYRIDDFKSMVERFT